jgi:hypothetical protein
MRGKRGPARWPIPSNRDDDESFDPDTYDGWDERPLHVEKPRRALAAALSVDDLRAIEVVLQALADIPAAKFTQVQCELESGVMVEASADPDGKIVLTAVS